MDPLLLLGSGSPNEREIAPSRTAHGVVGLLLVALSVAALARSPSRDAGAPVAQASRAASVRSAIPPPAPAAARLREGRPIDLNEALPGDLELLPGIGPQLARRIVEHRARSGRFSGVDALARVRGIGPKTLERLRPLVCAARCGGNTDAGTAATAVHRSSMNTVDTTAAR